MSMWLIATFGSSYVAKAQENFIEPFFIVKLILVIVVLPLLMYTCRQKCIKNGPRVAVQDDLRTEKESATEETSVTAENKTKKRRRQKKKRSTKNSEEKEQSSGGNKAKKHIDAACTGEEVQNQNADTAIAVKQGKDANKKNKDVASRPSVSSCTTTVEEIRDVKKRKKVVRSTAGCDVGGGTSRLDDKNSENAGTSDKVEVKDGKKGHKYATSSYIPNKSKNSDESCTVKEARNVGGGCKKLLENAIFSVLNQKSVCQNEKERNEGRLRGVNKLDNIPCEGTEESDSARNVNSRACHDTTPRQKQTSLAHKTNRKPSVNGMEHQETDCQGDGVGRTKNQSQGRFFSDSPEGQRNKANANADHQRWGTVPRRRSCDRNSEKDPKENEFPENHRHSSAVSCTERRSFDHSSEKDPRQSEPLDNDRYPTDKRARRRSSDRTSESDPRQSELLENERNYPTDKRARRRSSDHTSEKDPRQSELVDNDRYPTDKRARRRSSDRTSESDPRQSELVENERNYPTDKRARRRSSDHTSEKNPRQSELLEIERNYPTDKGTRRRSSDRTSESDPRQSELLEIERNYPTDKGTRRRSSDRSSESDPRQSELMENDRNYPTDKRARRRSFDHTSEKDARQSEFLENGRNYPTDKRARRRSFDRTSENVPRVSELPENRRDCSTNNRRGRRSSDCTSENDPKESNLRESHRHPADNRAKRRSSCHTSENVSRGSELTEKHRQLTELQRRRRSFDRTSESDPRQIEILENHRRPTDNRLRRRSFDGISENVPGRSELPENSRHCPTDNGTSTESEKPDEYEQGKTEHLTEPSPVHTAEADNEIFEATSTADKAGPKPSSHEGMKAVNGQGTLGSEQGPFVIDPEVRERIANPKYPVRVPDKPVLHLSYRDSSYRPDNFKGPNKSLVGGLFGRKWRKEMEKKELKRQAEEDAEEDRRRAEFLDHCDNTCPTFMVWGVCHRGDRCPLQHPSYRYLERPPRKAVSPENTSEEPKRDPNSYAAILEKRNSSEPEEFCNEAVLHNAESTTETNGISYSKALVNAKPDRQTSKVPVTKTSYEESWPSLGSSVQGRDVKAPKQDPVNVSQAWTSQKGSRITLEEKPKTTVDKLHTVSDAIIAQELQADEYAEMNEYDDYSYHPEEEFYEDNIYDQGQEDTNEDDESSFDSHDNVKALELEQLNSNFHSSPVIMEQSTGDTENPAPPRVVSSPCDICMDRPKDATLVCGHRFCYVCALQMRLDERVCAICRRCIVSVIKTYN